MKHPIRKAVGAIVLCDDTCLLVHKVKVMNTGKGPISIPGIWDFPKGGMQESETAVEAVLRELWEETGSRSYQIIRQFDEKICFTFDEQTRQSVGWERQETTMFLVKYVGDHTVLSPQDEEIDQVCFLPVDQVVQYLSHVESQKFYERVILAR